MTAMEAGSNTAISLYYSGFQTAVHSGFSGGILGSVISSLHIIYASTSGHTEYVVGVIADFLREHAPKIAVEVQRCDLATAEDLRRGDVLILGSGSWNTGGVEGQLNPHMYEYLRKTCKAEDLKGKKVGIVALGDDRYFYTARSGEHLRNFIQTHGGATLGDTLTVVNEPYGQEERVEQWAAKFLEALKKL